MRALRAPMLLALCAATLASWFHMEPVKRTVLPMRTTGPASAPPQDEALPLKALPAIEACLGERPLSLQELIRLVQNRGGEPSGETLEWRLVLFENAEGKRFRLAYRPPSLELSARNEAGAFLPSALPPSLKSLPLQEAFMSLFQGKIMLHDVKRTRFHSAGGRISWAFETDNGAVKALDYGEPGLRLRCSSAFGPTACECTRE